EEELADDTPLKQIKKMKGEFSRNFKALSFLHSAVSTTIFPRIMGVSTAKEVWDTLKEEFEGFGRTNAIRLLHLKREFVNLKMEKDETVKDFFSRIMEIVNQIKIFGEIFEEKYDVEKILMSLTEKFDPTVATKEQSKDLTTVRVVEL
ncbi:UBN2 domain-containing protein, partial [Cephalotus follicularis]